MGRVNHSCAPNARGYWDNDMHRELLVASRDIYPGEELHISYIPAYNWPHARRREYLSSAFGFDCCCSLCSLHPALRASSDDRRALIGRLDEAIMRKSDQPHMALAMVEHRI